MIRRLAWLLVLVPALLVAQQRDPSQSRVAASGTGEISGVVLSVDSTPGPVRRSVVTLTGSGPARSVITDDSGAFAFRSLPAESFFVTARKPAYLAAPYGATRPGRAGTAIALAAGQHATIALSIFKGAALSGVLRDASGAPVPGVDVRVIDARTLANPPDATPAEIASTDDRGVYRLFGLLPGEYVVMALPSAPGSEIGSPSTIELDRLLAELASKSRGGATTPGGAAPPSAPARAVSFGPVFYPGTASYLEAARVKIVAGGERDGVDFQVRPLPVASIEGRVSGNVANLAAVQVTIIPSGPRFATSFSSANLAGRPIDAEGKFRYSNLAPGRYRIVARATREEAAASPAGSPPGSLAIGRSGGGSTPTPAPSGPGAPVDYLYGFADVELRGDDVSGVSLVLQPGGTMSGRIVLNGTGAVAKPDDLTKGRTYLSYEGGGWSVSSDNLRMGPGIVSGGAATIKLDGTFEIRGIGPGRFTLGSTLPTGTTGWSLRSATAPAIATCWMTSSRWDRDSICAMSPLRSRMRRRNCRARSCRRPASRPPPTTSW